MNLQLREEIAASVDVYERAADDRERHPRFNGDEEAQLVWLGRTDRERIAELRGQAAIGRSILRQHPQR